MLLVNLCVLDTAGDVRTDVDCRFTSLASQHSGTETSEAR